MKKNLIRSLMLLSLPVLLLTSCADNSANGGDGSANVPPAGDSAVNSSLEGNALDDLIAADKNLLTSRSYDIKYEQYQYLGTYETSIGAPSGSLYCYLKASTEMDSDHNYNSVEIYYFYNAADASKTYKGYPSYFEYARGNRLVKNDTEQLFK